MMRDVSLFNDRALSLNNAARYSTMRKQLAGRA